jgi:hypothetical protein
MSGLTLANRVYIRTDYCPIDIENAGTVELVFHELVHVMQFRRNPILFPVRYLVRHLRYGYSLNPFEREARRRGAELTVQFLRRDLPV